jgi:hypothetical protein
VQGVTWQRYSGCFAFIVVAPLSVVAAIDTSKIIKMVTTVYWLSWNYIPNICCCVKGKSSVAFNISLVDGRVGEIGSNFAILVNAIIVQLCKGNF